MSAFSPSCGWSISTFPLWPSPFCALFRHLHSLSPFFFERLGAPPSERLVMGCVFFPGSPFLSSFLPGPLTFSTASFVVDWVFLSDRPLTILTYCRARNSIAPLPFWASQRLFFLLVFFWRSVPLHHPPQRDSPAPRLGCAVAVGICRKTLFLS